MSQVVQPVPTTINAEHARTQPKNQTQKVTPATNALPPVKPVQPHQSVLHVFIIINNHKIVVSVLEDLLMLAILRKDVLDVLVHIVRSVMQKLIHVRSVMLHMKLKEALASAQHQPTPNPVRTVSSVMCKTAHHVQQTVYVVHVQMITNSILHKHNVLNVQWIIVCIVRLMGFVRSVRAIMGLLRELVNVGRGWLNRRLEGIVLLVYLNIVLDAMLIRNAHHATPLV